MIQEVVEADPTVFRRVVLEDVEVVLEDVEESERALRKFGLGTVLAMEYFATKGNHPLNRACGSVSLGQGAKDSKWLHNPYRLGDSSAKGTERTVVAVGQPSFEPPSHPPTPLPKKR